MFAVKFLANQAVVCNCYVMFWACQTLHFSHFTFHITLEVLYYNWSELKAVNNVLTSWIKFIFMKKCLR